MQSKSLKHSWFHLFRRDSVCSATLTSGLLSQINILIQGCSYSCVVSSVVCRAMEICLRIIAAAAVAMATWLNDRKRVQEFTFESRPGVRESHEVSWWWIWKGLSEVENIWHARVKGRGEMRRWGRAKQSQDGGRGDKKQKGFFRHLQTTRWFQQGLEDWLRIDVFRSRHSSLQLLLASNCHSTTTLSLESVLSLWYWTSTLHSLLYPCCWMLSSLSLDLAEWKLLILCLSHPGFTEHVSHCVIVHCDTAVL